MCKMCVVLDSFHFLNVTFFPLIKNLRYIKYKYLIIPKLITIYLLISRITDEKYNN